MTEPIRISVERGKEAYAKSGLKPVRRATFCTNAEKQDCGCLIAAMALEAGCERVQEKILAWIPDNLGCHYAGGLIDGFDGRKSDAWQIKNNQRYMDGYEDGKAVAEELLGPFTWKFAQSN